jgi:hypothetical protein
LILSVVKGVVRWVDTGDDPDGGQMSRTVAALAAVAVGLSGLAAAATSSSSIGASTANRRSVEVSGASMTGVSYTVAAGVITGLTVSLAGHAPLGAVASARYGVGVAIPCVIGLYDAVNDRTPVTCVGLAEPANRPRNLLIAIS